MALGDGDNLTELRCGRAIITWNAAELGFSAEGSVVKIEKVRGYFYVHELGETPVDAVTKGIKATCTLQIAQWTVANLKAAIPELCGYKAGVLLYQYAKELKLHPQFLGEGDTSEDIILYKAIANEDPVELIHKIDAAKEPSVTFLAFPDRTKERGANIGSIAGQAFGV